MAAPPPRQQQQQQQWAPPPMYSTPLATAVVSNAHAGDGRSALYGYSGQQAQRQGAPVAFRVPQQELFIDAAHEQYEQQRPVHAMQSVLLPPVAASAGAIQAQQQQHMHIQFQQQQMQFQQMQTQQLAQSNQQQQQQRQPSQELQQQQFAQRKQQQQRRQSQLQQQEPQRQLQQQQLAPMKQQQQQPPQRQRPRHQFQQQQPQQQPRYQPQKQQQQQRQQQLHQPQRQLQQQQQQQQQPQRQQYQNQQQQSQQQQQRHDASRLNAYLDKQQEPQPRLQQFQRQQQQQRQQNAQQYQQPQQQQTQQYQQQAQQQYQQQQQQFQRPYPFLESDSGITGNSSGGSGSSSTAQRSGSAVIQPGVAIVPPHYPRDQIPMEMPTIPRLGPPSFQLPLVRGQGGGYSGFSYGGYPAVSEYGGGGGHMMSNLQSPPPRTTASAPVTFVPCGAATDEWSPALLETFVDYANEYNSHSSNSNSNSEHQFAKTTWNREQHYSPAASAISSSFNDATGHEQQATVSVSKVFSPMLQVQSFQPEERNQQQQQQQYHALSSDPVIAAAAKTLFALQSPVNSPRWREESTEVGNATDSNNPWLQTQSRGPPMLETLSTPELASTHVATPSMHLTIANALSAAADAPMNDEFLNELASKAQFATDYGSNVNAVAAQQQAMAPAAALPRSVVQQAAAPQQLSAGYFASNAHMNSVGVRNASAVVGNVAPSRTAKQGAPPVAVTAKEPKKRAPVKRKRVIDLTATTATSVEERLVPMPIMLSTPAINVGESLDNRWVVPEPLPKKKVTKPRAKPAQQQQQVNANPNKKTLLSSAAALAGSDGNDVVAPVKKRAAPGKRTKKQDATLAAKVLSTPPSSIHPPQPDYRVTAPYLPAPAVSARIPERQLPATGSAAAMAAPHAIHNLMNPVGNVSGGEATGITAAQHLQQGPKIPAPVAGWEGRSYYHPPPGSALPTGAVQLKPSKAKQPNGKRCNTQGSTVSGATATAGPKPTRKRKIAAASVAIQPSFDANALLANINSTSQSIRDHVKEAMEALVTETKRPALPRALGKKSATNLNHSSFAAAMQALQSSAASSFESMGIANGGVRSKTSELATTAAVKGLVLPPDAQSVIDFTADGNATKVPVPLVTASKASTPPWFMPTDEEPGTTGTHETAGDDLLLEQLYAESGAPPALPVSSQPNNTIMIFCKRDFMRYQALKLWKKYQEKKKKMEFQSVQVLGKRTRYVNAKYEEEKLAKEQKQQKAKVPKRTRKSKAGESFEHFQLTSAFLLEQAADKVTESPESSTEMSSEPAQSSDDAHLNKLQSSDQELAVKTEAGSIDARSSDQSFLDDEVALTAGMSPAEQHFPGAQSMEQALAMAPVPAGSLDSTPVKQPPTAMAAGEAVSEATADTDVTLIEDAASVDAPALVAPTETVVDTPVVVSTTDTSSAQSQDAEPSPQALQAPSEMPIEQISSEASMAQVVLVMEPLAEQSQSEARNEDVHTEPSLPEAVTQAEMPAAVADTVAVGDSSAACSTEVSLATLIEPTRAAVPAADARVMPVADDDESESVAQVECLSSAMATADPAVVGSLERLSSLTPAKETHAALAAVEDPGSSPTEDSSSEELPIAESTEEAPSGLLVAEAQDDMATEETTPSLTLISEPSQTEMPAFNVLEAFVRTLPKKLLTSGASTEQPASEASVFQASSEMPCLNEETTHVDMASADDPTSVPLLTEAPNAMPSVDYPAEDTACGGIFDDKAQVVMPLPAPVQSAEPNFYSSPPDATADSDIHAEQASVEMPAAAEMLLAAALDATPAAFIESQAAESSLAVDPAKKEFSSMRAAAEVPASQAMLTAHIAAQVTEIPPVAEPAEEGSTSMKQREEQVPESAYYVEQAPDVVVVRSTSEPSALEPGEQAPGVVVPFAEEAPSADGSEHVATEARDAAAPEATAQVPSTLPLAEVSAVTPSSTEHPLAVVVRVVEAEEAPPSADKSSESVVPASESSLLEPSVIAAEEALSAELIEKTPAIVAPVVATRPAVTPPAEEASVVTPTEKSQPMAPIAEALVARQAAKAASSTVLTSRHTRIVILSPDASIVVAPSGQVSSAIVTARSLPEAEESSATAAESDQQARRTVADALRDPLIWISACASPTEFSARAPIYDVVSTERAPIHGEATSVKQTTMLETQTNGGELATEQASPNDTTSTAQVANGEPSSLDQIEQSSVELSEQAVSENAATFSEHPLSDKATTSGEKGPICELPSMECFTGSNADDLELAAAQQSPTGAADELQLNQTDTADNSQSSESSRAFKLGLGSEVQRIELALASNVVAERAPVSDVNSVADPRVLSSSIEEEKPVDERSMTPSKLAASPNGHDQTSAPKSLEGPPSSEVAPNHTLAEEIER